MYKIILDNKIIDIVQHPKFILFLATGHIALTDYSSAQGIVGSDDKTIYSFIDTNMKYTKVSISKIESDIEFRRLQDLLNSGKSVSADATELSQAKLAKIESLSAQCQNIIVSGFSIKLSDETTQYFKLTVEDQLNLMLIENRLNSGDTYFVYHATNQPCKLYNKDDMFKIITAFRKHVLYHTTYFNAAKQYIKSLTDLEQVVRFSYGDSVLDIVEDATLRQILKNGSNY